MRVAKTKRQTKTGAEERVLVRLTQATAAKLIGQDPARLRQIQGIPRNRDGTYNAYELVQWWTDRNNRSPQADEDDPLLNDASPWSEKFRMWKARLAELEFWTRKGQVVQVETIRGSLTQLAVLIRRLGESLGKRYGGDASQAVNDMLAEFERVVSRDLGVERPTADGDGDGAFGATELQADGDGASGPADRSMG